MDATTLANTAVIMLGPYLRRLAGRVTDEAGDHLADAVPAALRRLYDLLKQRLPSGTYTGRQLEGLEEEPDRKSRQQALVAVLAEVLEEDEELAAEVRKLVHSDELSGLRASIGKVEGPVAIGGDVHQQGRYVAGHTLFVRTDKDPSGQHC